MSTSKPSSLNDFVSAGRSPFSQRLEESASGSITQARFAADEELSPLPLPLPLSSLPQAARATSPNAARAAAPPLRDITIMLVFLPLVRARARNVFDRLSTPMQRDGRHHGCQGSHPV